MNNIFSPNAYKEIKKGVINFFHLHFHSYCKIGWVSTPADSWRSSSWL